MPNCYDHTTFSFILTSGNPSTPESLPHFLNENLVEYKVYEGNRSKKDKLLICCFETRMRFI